VNKKTGHGEISGRFSLGYLHSEVGFTHQKDLRIRIKKKSPTDHDIIPVMFALITLIALTSLLMPVAGHAAVNDILPGDYFPLQPGQTSLAVYAFDREFRGPYVAGRNRLDGQINSNVIALRGAHAFQVDDMTLTAVAVLPWSDTQVATSPLAAVLGDQAKGSGDLRLGLTAWVINDKANANYLGLSGMVIAPTGEYDARQILNPAENRWKVFFPGVAKGHHAEIAHRT
jgi:hypothetical protein